MRGRKCLCPSTRLCLHILPYLTFLPLYLVRHMESDKAVLTAVVAHLRASETGNTKVKLVADSLSEIYNISVDDVSAVARNGLSFPSVYAAGLNSLSPAHSDPSVCDADHPAPLASTSSTAPSSAERRSAASDAGFKKFVSRLKSGTTFFANIEEGSPEYEKRLKRAKVKYESKMAAKRGSLAEVSKGSAGVVGESGDLEPPAVVSDENKKNAVAAKEEGNAELAKKDFAAAYDCYSRAIALDGTNAVYHSNQAAALIEMGRHSEAVSSCERAIAIDSQYLRARQRLASAYRHLGMHDKEAACLRAAVAVAPGNERLQEDALAASARARGDAATAHAGIGNAAVAPPDLSALFGGGNGNMPDLRAMADAAGAGGPGADDFMSTMVRQMATNPMMHQMASNPDLLNSLASNPQFAQMMSNPAAMQGIFQSMFGGNSGGGSADSGGN